MKCFISATNDPYFNIASEEYLLRQYTDDFFFLYINEPSVIVGKHQNTMAEVNYNYLRHSGVKAVRRLSGGGAVFHDLGNISFSFILNGEKGKLVDFRKYAQPILDVVRGLGVDADFSERNDMFAEGRKFSGNAEHVFKSRVLHHGTILYQSDLEGLWKCLRRVPGGFDGRGVKSVRSNVTNIATLVTGTPMDVDTFTNFLFQQVLQRFPQAEQFQLPDADHQAINQLISNKYSKWEWNYGYSPKFSLCNTAELEGELYNINITVEKGLVQGLDMPAPLLQSFNRPAGWLNDIIGQAYTFEAIMHSLAAASLTDREQERLAGYLF